MPNHVKESWSRHHQQIVIDAIKQTILAALPLGYTRQMVVKVSVDAGRVKDEVEHATKDFGGDLKRVSKYPRTIAHQIAAERGGVAVQYTSSNDQEMAK
jgi:hypothetical protein